MEWYHNTHRVHEASTRLEPSAAGGLGDGGGGGGGGGGATVTVTSTAAYLSKCCANVLGSGVGFEMLGLAWLGAVDLGVGWYGCQSGC